MFGCVNGETASDGGEREKERERLRENRRKQFFVEAQGASRACMQPKTFSSPTSPHQQSALLKHTSNKWDVEANVGDMGEGKEHVGQARGQNLRQDTLLIQHKLNRSWTRGHFGADDLVRAGGVVWAKGGHAKH